MLILKFLLLNVITLLGGVGAGVKVDFAVLVDAGSTGSRAFIFQYHRNKQGKRVMDSHRGKKINPGLASFAENVTGVVDYLLPLFLQAKKEIPPKHHRDTMVYIQGTAGMRLLPEETQDVIWDRVVNGLSNHPLFPFSIHRDTVGTLSGNSEAYFAVLATNFISGKINADLETSGSGMVGALDMGGSSTQLIFHKGETFEGEDGTKMQEHHFWSHSWLNHGVVVVRERVWKYLIDSQLLYVSEDTGEDGKPVLHAVNPCGFHGHEHLTEDGVVLKGIGDGKRCIEVIKQVIWPELSENSTNGACTEGRPCPVGGVEPPSVLENTRFYAMSMYYFAADCIRQLGPKNISMWPNPSLDEIEEAAHAFCSLDWNEDVRVNLFDKHAYTTNDQLAHRCMEALYLVTLLKQGFGFRGDTRDITYALIVEGKEVDWTLGYALAEISLPRPFDEKEFSESQQFENCNVDFDDDEVVPEIGPEESASIGRRLNGYIGTHNSSLPKLTEEEKATRPFTEVMEQRRVGELLSRVHVFDDAFPNHLLQSVDKVIEEAGFQYGSYSNGQHGPGHWNMMFSGAESSNHDTVEGDLPEAPLRIWRFMQSHYFAFVNVSLMECYVNAHTFGTEGYPHRDSTSESDVTVEVHLNPEWKREWAGETEIFSGDEIVFAAMPKYNRMTIFPSSFEYAARGVTRVCPVARRVLVFKGRIMG